MTDCRVRFTSVLVTICLAAAGCGKSNEERQAVEAKKAVESLKNTFDASRNEIGKKSAEESAIENAQPQAEKAKKVAEAFGNAFVAGLDEIGKKRDEERAREEAAEEALMKQKTIKLGQLITLQSLQIVPLKVEFRKIEDSGPYLVLTCRLKNISEGQVFPPSFSIEGKDSFGNKLEQKLHHWEGSEDDMLPGKTVTYIQCVERKIDTAKSYVWEIYARVNNKTEDSKESWRLEFDAKEISVW